MRKLVLSIAVLLALVAATGCGSDSSSTGDSSTAAKPFRIPLPGGEVAAIRYEKDMHPDASGLVGSPPKAVIPDSPPPETLALTDLIEGIGRIVFEGDEVSVQYVGYDYETGKKFASSWDEGKPLTFTLGDGEVIEGWESGLEDLEGGDRRELVIPPDMTKGSNPPGIPQGRTVVFVVEPVPYPVKAKAGKVAAKPAKKAKKPAKKVTKPAKKTKPKVVPPKGPPPKKLVVKDLEEGSGPAAKKGDEVTVQYVGVGYESGKQFDASWDRGEPFTFTLGGNGVIQGWEQGVEGMKAGGRRELVIPPDLAYGSEGAGTIAPNATLVFVIDLLAIK